MIKSFLQSLSNPSNNDDVNTPFRLSLWQMSVLLFLLAFAVRLPYLYSVPHFIDEWREQLVSVRISSGDRFPLHNAAHDIGAFSNYLTAVFFWIFGRQLWIPRLLVTLFSAGTVVLTYRLALYWVAPAAAFVAALLLATDSMHILVTHMSWSNDLTPFFVTLSLWMTMHCLSREKLINWAITGLLWGVTLQTHPSVITVLIAVLFFLTQRLGFRTFYRSKRLGIGFIGFLIGYANMIVWNIVHPLDSVRWLHHKEYALNDALSVSVYIRNVVSFVVEWLRSLASFFPHSHQLWFYSGRLMIVMYTFALLRGILVLLKKKDGLLLLYVILSSVLIIPLLNHRYAYYISTRYLAYLFPVGFIVICVGFQNWFHSLFHSVHFVSTRIKYTVFGVVFLGMLVLPLDHFYVYAQQYQQTRADNSAEFRLVRAVRAMQVNHRVLIDAQARQAKAVGEMFDLIGIPNRLVGDAKQAFGAPKPLQSKEIHQWQEAMAQEEKKAWYVLSIQRVEPLSIRLHMHWKECRIITNQAGIPTYFIGRKQE